MKTTLTTAALALAAIAAALALGSCAGTTLTLHPDGSVSLTAPARAIIVEGVK